LPGDLFAGHNRVEQLHDAEMLENLGDDSLCATRRHGHRNFSVVLLRDAHHDVDRFDLVDQRQVFRL